MEMFSYPCDQILEFAVLARSEYKVLKKSRIFKSNSRNYKYSIIDDYIDACLDAWTKYKLCLSHHESIHEPSGLILIETKLSHSTSSQWMRTVTFLKPEGDRQQDYGSAISYKRRYQMSSLLGLGGTEDDEAMIGDEIDQYTSNHKENRGNTITLAQTAELYKLIAQSIDPDNCEKAVMSYNKIKKIEDLPSGSYEGARNWILNFKG